MAAKTKEAKDSSYEEDESEDLDVQGILNYHLKEVLDLVSKSTVEPGRRVVKKFKKKKVPVPAITKEKFFGDTEISPEKQPQDRGFTSVSDVVLPSSTKSGKENSEDSTMTNTQINSPNDDKTSTTKDEKLREKNEKEAVFGDAVVQSNRSANNQDFEDLKNTAHVRRKSFHMLSTSSPGVSSARKQISPSDESEDDETGDDENGDDDDELDEEEEDYFTLYRTSMYRASIYGHEETKTTSSSPGFDFTAIPSTHGYESSEPTAKASSLLTDSGSSGESSSRVGYSSHSTFFSDMRHKYKAPTVAIKIDPEDYTAYQRNWLETKALLARHKVISKGTGKVLYNSPRKTRQLFNILYDRFYSFFQQRIASIRGKAKQGERLIAFREKIDNELLKSPYVARDSKTGGITLARRRSKYKLPDKVEKLEIVVTPSPLEPQTTAENQRLYDFRRRTPFFLKNPMKARVCGRTSSFDNSVSSLRWREREKTHGQLVKEATDLLPESIDHQTTHHEEERRIPTRIKHKTSSFVHNLMSGIESGKEAVPFKFKPPSLTRDEILDILETPDMQMWEQLYIANPNFSLLNYVHTLQKGKPVVHSRGKSIHSRRKSRFGSALKSKKKKKRLSVATENFVSLDDDT